MLESEIKKLTAAIEALTAAMGSQSPVAVSAPSVEPEPAVKAVGADATKELSVDDLTRVCLGLSRDGHRDAIKAKLSDLGAARLGELKGDNYTTFADWAVELSERAE